MTDTKWIVSCAKPSATSDRFISWLLRFFFRINFTDHNFKLTYDESGPPGPLYSCNAVARVTFGNRWRDAGQAREIGLARDQDIGSFVADRAVSASSVKSEDDALPREFSDSHLGNRDEEERREMAVTRHANNSPHKYNIMRRVCSPALREADMLDIMLYIYISLSRTPSEISN